MIHRRQVMLCRTRGMFVTFDGVGATPRAKATWLHDALALWLPRHPCFLEFRLPTSHGLFFPTFADAGWYRFFRSVPVTEPHRWTHPHTPASPHRQPEAVQVRTAMDTLPSTDDFRVVPP